jgi:hypothetical protein
MLAPSPDWFFGVSALDLCEGGRWAAERTVELFAYDAGTDSGPSYKSPDADTQPREPIRRIETPPFRVGGALRAAGYADLSPRRDDGALNARHTERTLERRERCRRE